MYDNGQYIDMQKRIALMREKSGAIKKYVKIWYGAH